MCISSSLVKNIYERKYVKSTETVKGLKKLVKSVIFGQRCKRGKKVYHFLGLIPVLDL